jgi:hypothetical protein
MIHRVTYGVFPILVIMALSGCRQDSKNTDHHPLSASGVPADVVKRYYDAIESGHYDSAYALWEGSGTASGQTLVQFENGFARTERTTATIGDSVQIGAAAGSQYATVPVSVDAILRGGKRQHFVGTYTVRRAMVDGATPEQRTWHIYSAHLVEGTR